MYTSTGCVIVLYHTSQPTSLINILLELEEMLITLHCRNIHRFIRFLYIYNKLLGIKELKVDYKFITMQSLCCQAGGGTVRFRIMFPNS